MNKYKILVIGTSSRTRGGVSSVINAYKQTDFWQKWNIIWIESHIDKNIFFKLGYFFNAVLIFLFHILSAKLVHVHLSEPVSAFRKLFFIIIAKLFGKKLIVHFHSFSPDTTLYSNISFIYKYIFYSADRIVVLSNYWKKEMNIKWPSLSSKIVVIYNPCTLVNKSDLPKENIILFAGTLNNRKGFQDLLASFALIYHKYPSWHLVFAGNGQINTGKEIAKALNISDRTHFVGWVESEEKELLFQKASIFCLPSYAEGFPMAVLDAFSYSLPVITTPVGGIPDILTNSVNALIFEPGDIDTLSIQLMLCIDDSNLRHSLANASYELANTLFNLHSISCEVNSLYFDLLS
ncbi:glycosyltransferase family 4 protein [Spirosoma pollinicola]|uniref:Glycosyltransferase family 1 protein n=1 Tax=Spirosoma pollinicola TaxID=2057025 RepID=A0A2K8ZAU0_9BACT|nr:glycosyltransferase family 4 protein [Spirosoma pollinicola]AUD06965.1 glycosyltransferase family 1 protein [Spirosoma pollinicola]